MRGPTCLKVCELTKKRGGGGFRWGTNGVTHTINDHTAAARPTDVGQKKTEERNATTASSPVEKKFQRIGGGGV